MINSNLKTNIYLCRENIDMRKSIDGLVDIVESQFNLNPYGGTLYIFAGKNKKKIKMLYWDKNGFALWQKRLEEDRFPWPRQGEALMELSAEQLS